MILSNLDEIARHAVQLPGLEAAAEWLRAFDPTTPDGRHDIDGERVFALVSRYETGPGAERRFEAHRRYLDVQYLAAGVERILHAPTPALEVAEPYREADDLAFFRDPPASSSLLLRPGELAVFLPADAHKPGCMAGGREAVLKVVVKVLLNG